MSRVRKNVEFYVNNYEISVEMLYKRYTQNIPSRETKVKKKTDKIYLNFKRRHSTCAINYATCKSEI